MTNPERSIERKVLIWTLFILGFLLLSLAGSLRGDSLPGRATRTQNWNATGAIRSLALENVSGDVTVSAGSSFAATAAITVKARTDDEAKKRLDETKVAFKNEDGNLVLWVDEPGATVKRSGRGWSIHSHHDGDRWRIDVKYDVTMPPGASLDVTTVNGKIDVKGIAGELKLSTVNGSVTFGGARSDARLNTVNGTIDGSFAELAKGREVKADTVNGTVTLRLPASAGFHFSGRTMNGDILSTFPFAAASASASATAEDRAVSEKMKAERDKLRAERDRIRAERDKTREKAREKRREAREAERDDDDSDEEVEIVDLSGLNDMLRDLDREMSEMSGEIARSVRVAINRQYEATVGGGGASVTCSTLNGKIVVLAEGTTEAQAKKLLSSQRGRAITVPPVPAPPRVVVIPPRPPHVGSLPHAPSSPDEAGSIVKGNVEGDFYTSLPFGDVRLGSVSGSVKVSTRAGQIRVDKAGKGAELSSSGGDIRIEAVTGNLTATTYGGDVMVGSVSGDAKLETKGGDIVVRSASGRVNARTGGGDLKLTGLAGAVKAETSGGTVVCELSGAGAHADSEIVTHGGDVVLTLPAGIKADLDVKVSGVDEDGDYIVSAFPELAVTKRHGSQSGEARLNGGGPKLFVRSTSGTVTIKKGS